MTMEQTWHAMEGLVKDGKVCSYDVRGRCSELVGADLAFGSSPFLCRFSTSGQIDWRLQL